MSGRRATAIASQLIGELPAARQASYRQFHDSDGATIDDGIVIYFRGPDSFTGEDVVEFQGHGGPVVVMELLERLFALGARQARPGEFSERAFLNGRLDLVQAEAIADLIDSDSRQASRAARRSLDGEFSRRIHALVADLTALRVDVEANLDFSDEPVDILPSSMRRQRLQKLAEDLARLLADACQGRLLREGIHVVIAGPPNAGKSSLLNRLARHDRAIVSDIPGTTRDVLREEILLDGLPLHIIDTAGMRQSADPIERLGIERAEAEMARADHILMVSSATDGAETPGGDHHDETPSAPVTRIINKIDLTGRAAAIVDNQNTRETSIYLSARTGEGVDLLIEHLKRCVGYQTMGEGLFSARQRHLDALERTAGSLQRAAIADEHDADELLAEELRLAQQYLGEITGEVSSDDLLGEIFASFCIGK